MRLNGRVSWGVILIVIGAVFLMDSAGILDVGELVATFWPVMLVLWGAWLIMRRKTKDKEGEPVSGPLADIGIGRRIEETSDGHVSFSNVFGDVRSRIVSPSFTGGKLSSVFGDVEADLSTATFAAGEQGLKLDTVFGRTRVLLPREVAYAVTGDAVMGKVSVAGVNKGGFFPALDFATPGYREAPRRIRIDASTVFGEVVVIQLAGQDHA